MIRGGMSILARLLLRWLLLILVIDLQYRARTFIITKERVAASNLGSSTRVVIADPVKSRGHGRQAHVATLDALVHVNIVIESPHDCVHIEDATLHGLPHKAVIKVAFGIAALGNLLLDFGLNWRRHLLDNHIRDCLGHEIRWVGCHPLFVRATLMGYGDLHLHFTSLVWRRRRLKLLLLPDVDINQRLKLYQIVLAFLALLVQLLLLTERFALALLRCSGFYLLFASFDPVILPPQLQFSLHLTFKNQLVRDLVKVNNLLREL